MGIAPMTVSAFFHMGGYAFYVWTSYGLATVLMIFNVVSPLRREKRLLRSIARLTRRRDR